MGNLTHKGIKSPARVTWLQEKLCQEAETFSQAVKVGVSVFMSQSQAHTAYPILWCDQPHHRLPCKSWLAPCWHYSAHYCCHAICSGSRWRSHVNDVSCLPLPSRPSAALMTLFKGPVKSFLSSADGPLSFLHLLFQWNICGVSLRRALTFLLSVPFPRTSAPTMWPSSLAFWWPVKYWADHTTESRRPFGVNCVGLRLTHKDSKRWDLGR